MKFRNLEINDKFYLVDIKHAYWRVAYKLGYISKFFYEKYADDKEMKKPRNMALSTLVSSSTIQDVVNGIDGNKFIEDVGIYQTIYRNIRFTVYNLLGRLYEKVQDDCYGYRIDGIFVKEHVVDKTIKFFNRHGYKVKVVECVKVDYKHYAEITTAEIKEF